MSFNKNTSIHIKALLASFCLLISLPSLAAYTLVNAAFDGSDCGTGDELNTQTGFFECEIAKDGVEFAYVISKFENDFTVDEMSGDYSGSDWTFTSNTENTEGTWNYTGSSPDIRFWTAKAGNGSGEGNGKGKGKGDGGGNQEGGFNLFWYIDSNDVSNSCAGNTKTDASNFNYSCLNLAKTVDSGSWSTPGGKNLSHLTFFTADVTCKPNCPVTSVPEPQTLMLLALGMLGLVARQKRTTVKNS